MKGYRWICTELGTNNAVGVRAKTQDEAERIAAEDLGLPIRRVISYRLSNNPNRRAGQFASKPKA